jgi:hypothetical protein
MEHVAITAMNGSPRTKESSTFSGRGEEGEEEESSSSPPRPDQQAPVNGEFVSGVETTVEPVVFNYFEETIRAILSRNGFRGYVEEDFCVFDSEFRRRALSSIGTLDRAQQESAFTEEWWITEGERASISSDGSSFSIRSGRSGGGDGQNSYVEFFCNITSSSSSGGGMSVMLFKRFSDFEKLEHAIKGAIIADKVALIVPALPPKQVFSFNGRWKDNAFVQQRRILLDAWLKAVLQIQSKGGAHIQDAFLAFFRA